MGARLTGAHKVSCLPTAKERILFALRQAGTFNWTEFSSTTDQSGKLLPASVRIVLADNKPHELNLLVENSNGTGGTAWIDDVQLIDPNGQVQPVIGQFDTTIMDEDTAWYNQAYGDVFGGAAWWGLTNHW